MSHSLSSLVETIGLHYAESSTPNKQVFSFGIVEEKRYHRTLVSVINGVGVAQAIREGLIMEQPEVEDDEAEEDTEANDDNSMFVPETKKEDIKSDPRNPFLMFNPQASIFTPTASTSQACFPTSTSSGLSQTTGVGKTDAATPLFPFDDTAKVPITGIFGSTAIFKNPFGPQPTTSQASSSTFTSAATAAVGSISSFGMPSFPASAPSSSAPLTAPSGVNNAWPPILVNGLLKSRELRIHFHSAVLLFTADTDFGAPFAAASAISLFHSASFLHFV